MISSNVGCALCLLDILYTGNIYKYDWYSSRVETRVGSIHSRTMHQSLVNTRAAAIKETIKNSVECAFYFSGWVYFVMCLRIIHNLSFYSAKLSGAAVLCVNIIRLYLNTLRPRGRHDVDHILKSIFPNENLCILIQLSLKFIHKRLINSIHLQLNASLCFKCSQLPWHPFYYSYRLYHNNDAKFSYIVAVCICKQNFILQINNTSQCMWALKILHVLDRMKLLTWFHIYI